ncbi:UDP-forming cellulose synthase catalytic subunit, partial [Burkholderia sp. SIMBA_051]
WARGMAQIIRTNNPLLGKGLKIGQRLCYLSAMLHFFFGLPRVVFLTAPLAYLFFHANVFQASAIMVAAYALPHIVLSNLTG